MTRRYRLADADKASLESILAASPELAAVTNGLSLRWSSGAVEGHFNRKLIPIRRTSA